jgi:uncharacterized MnhB-related membrane protein
MILELDIILLTFLVITAVGAIIVKDLLSAVIIFSGYSFFMAVTFVQLNAPDVAITEAAVGAGITTVLFIVALYRITTKRSVKD